MKRICLAAGSLVVAAIVSTVALSGAQAQAPGGQAGVQQPHPEYLVVNARTIREFQENVQNKMKEGYILKGDMIVTVIPHNSEERYYQVLIR